MLIIIISCFFISIEEFKFLFFVGHEIIFIFITSVLEFIDRFIIKLESLKLPIFFIYLVCLPLMK